MTAIEKDGKALTSAKDAIDLVEAIQLARAPVEENGPPVGWDEAFVNQVIGILQTHPVSSKTKKKSMVSAKSIMFFSSSAAHTVKIDMQS